MARSPIGRGPLVQEHRDVAVRGEGQSRDRLTVDHSRSEGDIALIKQAILADSPEEILVVPEHRAGGTIEPLNLPERHGWPRKVPDMHRVHAYSLLTAVVIRDCNLGSPFGLGRRRPLARPPSDGGDGGRRREHPFRFLPLIGRPRQIPYMALAI